MLLGSHQKGLCPEDKLFSWNTARKVNVLPVWNLPMELKRTAQLCSTAMKSLPRVSYGWTLPQLPQLQKFIIQNSYGEFLWSLLPGIPHYFTKLIYFTLIFTSYLEREAKNILRCEDEFPLQNLLKSFLHSNINNEKRIQLIQVNLLYGQDRRDIRRHIPNPKPGSFSTFEGVIFCCVPTCLSRFTPCTLKQSGFTVSTLSVMKSGSKPEMRRKCIETSLYIQCCTCCHPWSTGVKLP